MSQHDEKCLPHFSSNEIYSAERAAIAYRRAQVKFDPTRPDQGVRENRVSDELVGVALSGGGIRSAAFSLGILQGFHRFGLLRFVDFVSAVSGGTYTAGMLTNAVSPERKYAEDEFALAQEPTGRPSPYVAEVSKRGNSLVRADLFVSRFVPNLLLNLLPRLAFIISIGAGIAFLWRCLDYYSVRDRFDAFGYGNDYVPALAPALAMGMLWALTYVSGLVFQSERLIRFATALMWITFASVGISMAVLIGNGDIGLGGVSHSSLKTENRIVWLNELWKPLIGAIGVGCLPLFFPRSLLRSGANPSHWLHSWIFYYVSLVVFLGVPLGAVAWFSREDISGFNKVRGPELLLADVKNPLAFEKLAQGEADGTAFKLDDYGLVARLNVNPSFSNVARLLLGTLGASPISIPVVPPMTPIGVLSDAIAARDAAKDRLQVEDEFPNDRDRLSTVPAEPNDPTGNRKSLSNWAVWRYLRFPAVTLRSFARSLFEDASGPTGSTPLSESRSGYSQSLTTAAEARRATISMLQAFNAKMSQRLLFDVRRLPQNAAGILSAPNDVPISGSLRDYLQTFQHFGQDDLQGSHSLASPGEVADINRMLLEVCYPGMIRPRPEVRRVNVIEYDQIHRLIWCLGAAVAALFLGWCINPNRTSLHEFYRDRLDRAFLSVKTPSDRPRRSSAASLASVTTHDQGLPYLLFNTASLPPNSWKLAEQLEGQFEPFLLSPQFVGSKDQKFVRTSDLSEGCSLSVADAMAISGAAISPAYYVHHIVSLLLSFLNFRTGQLLPNPKRFPDVPAQPSMLREFWENFRRKREDRSFVTLTDGGHVENLGIEPLLIRRCRLIIACDAGHDPDHTLDDLAKVFRRVETEYGIRISDVTPDTKKDSSPADGFPVRVPAHLAAPIGATNDAEPLGRLRKLFASGLCNKHYFAARIIYPECGPETKSGSSLKPELEGRLIYIKPCLTGDEGLSLYNFAIRNPEFPHEPSSDQAFSESQFDAYRKLGFHSAADLCSQLPDPATTLKRGSTLWEENSHSPQELIRKLVPHARFGMTAPVSELEAVQWLASLTRSESLGSDAAVEIFSRLEGSDLTHNRPLINQFCVVLELHANEMVPAFAKWLRKQPEKGMLPEDFAFYCKVLARLIPRLAAVPTPLVETILGCDTRPCRHEIEKLLRELARQPAISDDDRIRVLDRIKQLKHPEGKQSPESSGSSSNPT